MKMVVTLKSGAQIRVGVKEFTIRRSPVSGELRGLNWTYDDDDPYSTSLSWLDVTEIAAVHAERGPGDVARDEGPRRSARSHLLASLLALILTRTART